MYVGIDDEATTGHGFKKMFTEDETKEIARLRKELRERLFRKGK